MASEQAQAYLLATLKKLVDNNRALNAELASATPGGASSYTLDTGLDEDAKTVFDTMRPHLQTIAVAVQIIRELKKIGDYLKPTPPPAVEVTPVPKAQP